MGFFTNKVVWITGASSGLGEELALQLSRENARLILTARNAEALARVKEQTGATCFLLPADLEKDNLDQLSAAALQAFGHIDILINNAGVTQRALAEDTRLEVDRRLMEINFFAPVALTKSLLPHFRERKTGQVVVMSSMAGLMGFPLRTSYAAAKHALQGYFETLQVEHTIPGFSILIASPGRVNTPISLHALTGSGQAHNKMDKGQANGIPVATCARKIVAGMRKEKKRVIVARSERLLWVFHKFCPPLYYYIARKVGANQ
ncbi:short chain dehydrogenase [Chitinophaga alhagiae]|uniref:Short chain dehydrogenase n=1 Tax=Chitinophaga alhagiae TaxID=2203219 RepID=A0ABM6WBJ6_9BACT|nr:SDR family oxidoreductase [Chitinophaga alhagiae]AWO01349.1 short chain dehydrogenase [Chitinophaga alhagiae]